MIARDTAMAVFARRIFATGKLWLKVVSVLILSLFGWAVAVSTLPVAYWITFSPTTVSGRLIAIALIIPSTFLIGSLLWVIADAALIAVGKEAMTNEL